MMIDMHSHILPGLDDGAADWEQAIAMARIAVDDGITEMVCTPHWVLGKYENGREAIRRRFVEFEARLAAEEYPPEDPCGGGAPARYEHPGAAPVGRTAHPGQRRRLRPAGAPRGDPSGQSPRILLESPDEQLPPDPQPRGAEPPHPGEPAAPLHVGGKRDSRPGHGGEPPRGLLRGDPGVRPFPRGASPRPHAGHRHPQPPDAEAAALRRPQGD